MLIIICTIYNRLIKSYFIGISIDCIIEYDAILFMLILNFIGFSGQRIKHLIWLSPLCPHAISSVIFDQRRSTFHILRTPQNFLNCIEQIQNCFNFDRLLLQ